MDRPRCVDCREVVGVYEPVRVVLCDGSELRGSWLTLARELRAPGSVAVHESCYAQRTVDADGR